MTASAVLENANMMRLQTTWETHATEIMVVRLSHRHWIILETAAIQEIFYALDRDVLISNLLPYPPRKLVIGEFKLSFHNGLH